LLTGIADGVLQQQIKGTSNTSTFNFDVSLTVHHSIDLFQ